MQLKESPLDVLADGLLAILDNAVLLEALLNGSKTTNDNNRLLCDGKRNLRTGSSNNKRAYTSGSKGLGSIY